MKTEITHNGIGEIVVKNDDKIVFVGSESGITSYPGLFKYDNYTFTKKESAEVKKEYMLAVTSRNNQKRICNLNNERPLQEGIVKC